MRSGRNTLAGVTPAGFSGVDVGNSYDVANPICAQPIIVPVLGEIEARVESGEGQRAIEIYFGWNFRIDRAAELPR